MANREAECLRGGVEGVEEEGDGAPGAGSVGLEGDTGEEDVLVYS